MAHLSLVLWIVHWVAGVRTLSALQEPFGSSIITIRGAHLHECKIQLANPCLAFLGLLERASLSFPRPAEPPLVLYFLYSSHPCPPPAPHGQLPRNEYHKSNQSLCRGDFTNPLDMAIHRNTTMLRTWCTTRLASVSCRHHGISRGGSPPSLWRRRLYDQSISLVEHELAELRGGSDEG